MSVSAPGPASSINARSVLSVCSKSWEIRSLSTDFMASDILSAHKSSGFVALWPAKRSISFVPKESRSREKKSTVSLSIKHIFRRFCRLEQDLVTRKWSRKSG